MFFWEWGWRRGQKKNQKCGGIDIYCLSNFIDIVKIHRASCTKSATFQKVYVQRDGCSSMHMDYLFPAGNGNVLFYRLNFEFPFIMKEIVPF